MALKELEVRYATNYRRADGEGRHPLFRANGAKLWQRKCRFAGEEKLPSFGAYPAVGQADARLRCAEATLVLAEQIQSVTNFHPSRACFRSGAAKRISFPPHRF